MMPALFRSTLKLVRAYLPSRQSPYALNLLLLSLLTAGPCGATDVTWLVYSTPFTFIEQGPQAGQGAGDRQLQYLFQRLPQYHNHVLHASFTRIWSEIAQRDGVCTHVTFRGPEREKVAVFTDRPVKLAGYRLIAHARDASRYQPFLTAKGEIDLKRLLAADFRGSYVTARLLPPAISEALMDKEEIKSDMTPMQTPLQILQSFSAGRLDFFLSLPIEADYYRDMPLSREPRIVFPIKGVPREVEIYSACSNAPLGRTVIRAINAILKSNRNWADFISPYRDYFDPVDFNESLTSQPEPDAAP